MRIKTILAPSMPDALKIIKHDLGPDAVILNTRKVKNANGELTLEITAAIDNSTETVALAPAKITKPIINLKPQAHNLENIFQAHGLNFEHTKTLITAIKGVADAGFSAQDALEMLLAKKIKFANPAETVARGHAHVFIGTTGAGKTTLMCKLAVARKKSGASIGLISLDDQKIAGTAPLTMVANMLGEQAHIIGDEKDISTAAKSLGQRHYLFIDTPGLNPMHKKDINLFKKRLDALKIPLNVHLVIPANLNGADMSALPYAFQVLKPVSIIFTKIDETNRVGNMLNTLLDSPLTAGIVCNSSAIETSPLPLTATNLACKLLKAPTPIWEEAV